MLPTAPSIVGTVGDLDTLRSLSQLQIPFNFDFLELRLDAYTADANALETPLPPARYLLTARDPAEGGLGGLDAKTRRALLFKHLEKASLIDIEIRNLSASAALLHETRAAKIPIIASFHDFQRMPTREALETALTIAIDAGAEAAKFAVTTQTSTDLRTLVDFFEKNVTRLPLCAMGMGRFGKVSRLLLAQCGSLLNYAYLQKPNAPGQWSVEELRLLFDELL